jgi:hypothetical protein
MLGYWIRSYLKYNFNFSGQLVFFAPNTAKLLFYLIRKIDDLASPLALSHTCSQFRAIYQDEKLYYLT